MEIVVSTSKEELGMKAADKAAKLINKAIEEKGFANLTMATGMSQFEMLNELVKKNVSWENTNCFHLDEYVGLPASHPASFRKYLKERFVDIVSPGNFHYINGEENILEECTKLEKLITSYPIDVAFVGIGENAHLAFNDPPADFNIDHAYIQVELDNKCKQQQVDEGWFASLAEVPKSAVSMTIKQILKSKHIICCVPDERKANAIKDVVEGEVTPNVPSSILKQHPSTFLYLDQFSSSLLFGYTS